MLTRPDALVDDDVAAALEAGWGLAPAELHWVPVGFGSHHWSVVTASGERWFATADDLHQVRRHRDEPLASARRRLEAALSTAMALRARGLTFVVAPRPAREGSALHPVTERYVLAVYPHVDGRSHSWGAYRSTTDRSAVVALLAALHDTHVEGALPDDLVIDGRDTIDTALSDLHRPWDAGPFSGQSRSLLREHAAALGAALHRYDLLAAAVGRELERRVITHGEPHRANTITTADGPVLVDWETTLLAPPERDLWFLVSEDASVTGDYEARTGRSVSLEAIELYRLKWDFSNIAEYLGRFRRPHATDADTECAWDSLREYLDPRRWAAP